MRRRTLQHLACPEPTEDSATTTIGVYTTITYRHGRTTHVRHVQLEMSLRRNHTTATVVKSSA